MEFFRKYSGVRINVDELEQILAKDMIDVLAEMIISMDEILPEENPGEEQDGEAQRDESLNPFFKALDGLEFFQTRNESEPN